MTSPTPVTVAEVDAGLRAHGYLPDEGLATAVFLALALHRPLLLEGDPGVGKTEVAKVLAAWTGGVLLRLQCYEGIDASQALYEWDYARQLLHLRTIEAAGGVAGGPGEAGGPGPFEEPPPVLLIDEVDRADDEFEAFLLEVLADFTVTVPELGTFRAPTPPVVVVTSNRTRDVHDALKRRCLYHWVEHPDVEREVEIVRLRAPEVPEALARHVAAAAEALRDLGLYKPPGVAETIDWARSLALLGRSELDAASASATLGAVVKYREDAERARHHGIDELVAAARARD